MRLGPKKEFYFVYLNLLYTELYRLIKSNVEIFNNIVRFNADRQCGVCANEQ